MTKSIRIEECRPHSQNENNVGDAELNMEKGTSTADSSTTNKTIPTQKTVDPSFVDHVHKMNFARLVREVLNAEEVIVAILSSPMKQSISKKGHMETKSRYPNSRWCKNSNQDLLILRQETTLLKVRQKHAQGIARALSQFERAVYSEAEMRGGEEKCHSETIYRLAVNPVQRQKEMEHIFSHINQNQQQQLIMKTKKLKPPEEYQHNHLADIVTILILAYSILQSWRRSLQQGDRVCAPDYMDDYLPSGGDIGWVKMFDSIVLDVVGSSGSHGRKAEIGLGDSSVEEKQMYVLQEGEIAVHLHYLGYPKSQDQWFLVGDEGCGNGRNKENGRWIFPTGSQEASLLSLGIKAEEMQDDTSSYASTESNSSDSILNDTVETNQHDKKIQPDGVWTEEEDQILVQTVISEISGDEMIDESVVRTVVLSAAFWKEMVAVRLTHQSVQSAKLRLSYLREQIGRDSLISNIIDTKMRIEQSNDEVLLKGGKINDNHIKILAKERNPKSPEQQRNVKGKNLSKMFDKLSDKKVLKKGMKKKHNIEEEKDLSLTWICTECCEAECMTQPDSPLLVCEGGCSRAFHYPCVGLASVPPVNEKWTCPDCLDRRHQCAVCHEYGNDDEEVYKCEVKSCGLFYHEACLSMYDVNVELAYKTVTEGDEEKVISRPKFRCPAHQCWTCSGSVPSDTISSSECDCNKTLSTSKPKKKDVDGAFREKKGTLFRCLYCPIAYHLSCIPPLSQFHELALLCHEHANTRKLPYLDASSSMQGEIEANTEKWLENLRKKKKRKVPQGKNQLLKTLVDIQNPFLQGMRGNSVPLFQKRIAKVLSSTKIDNSSFCLPLDVQNEVHSKPPAYTHIHTNRYNLNHRPKPKPPSCEVCQCSNFIKDSLINACDDHCINRMLSIECIGDSKKKIGDKDPYWNCNCGPDCGNRRLSRRQFAKCRPKRQKGKGWGLIAVDGIKEGDLVQEYVGEIVDEMTKRERLEVWAQEHPNDPNFYIMQLQSGWYIDAREKGNLSRFINHSCEPNCKLDRVNVRGHTRVAIVSTRNILSGEFLSYDYQFDTRDGDKFICRCGSLNCRGTMKKGSNGSNLDSTEEKKKTKREIWLEAKTRFDRDKIFLQGLTFRVNNRLNQVSSSLPGEKENSSNTIASGPQFRMATDSREKRVCLWRNIIHGSDFSSRHWKLHASIQKQKAIPKARIKELALIDVLSIIKKTNDH